MGNNHLKIQVMGAGCTNCKKLYGLTKKAVAELKLDIEVEYITDIQKIVAMGLIQSPILAINGKPILIGIIPDLEKIKQAIKDNI